MRCNAGLQLYDAFNKFDYDKNGFLSPAEVWGAFSYLRVELTALDVLCFVGAADQDRDGNMSFREFVDILTAQEQEQEGGVGVAGAQGVAGASLPPSPLPASHPALFPPSQSTSAEAEAEARSATLSTAADSLPMPAPIELVRSQSLRARALRRQVGDVITNCCEGDW
jgi:hypothetical protein